MYGKIVNEYVELGKKILGLHKNAIMAVVALFIGTKKTPMQALEYVQRLIIILFCNLSYHSNSSIKLNIIFLSKSSIDLKIAISSVFLSNLMSVAMAKSPTL